MSGKRAKELRKLAASLWADWTGVTEINYRNPEFRKFYRAVKRDYMNGVIG